MRLVFISDTHNQLDKIPVPDGDILVHAGDLTSRGTNKELRKACEELDLLVHKYKVVIAGNHDWCFANGTLPKHEAVDMFAAIGVTYLHDSEATIEGLRFYGSPYQPRFFDWAFNLDDDELKRKWSRIPAGIDVLITHGPPYGILDNTIDHRNVGCRHLLNEVVDRVKPRIHAFGHIHHAYGREYKHGTLFVNASNLDETYRYANKPIVVDLP